MTPEERREYERAWKQENPAKVAAWAKAGTARAKAADPEGFKLRHREYQRKWRLANLEKAQEKARKSARDWYWANEEQAKAYSRAYGPLWRKQNPGAALALSSRRRARKLQAMPNWLTDEHHDQMAKLYAAARQFGCHVDHIVPLLGKTVCGLHVPWNLQILDPESNLKKGNRLLH